MIFTTATVYQKRSLLASQKLPVAGGKIFDRRASNDMLAPDSPFSPPRDFDFMKAKASDNTLPCSPKEFNK